MLSEFLEFFFFCFKEDPREYEIVHLKEIVGTLIIKYREFLEFFFCFKEDPREYEIIHLKEIVGTLIIKYRGA